MYKKMWTSEMDFIIAEKKYGGTDHACFQTAYV